MATKNIVPRAAHEGQIGTTVKPWAKVVTDKLDILQPYSRMTVAESECFVTAFPPLSQAAVATGTIVAGTATSNHPGVMTFKTSTSANSGYYILAVGVNAMLLGGGEEFNVIFYVDATTDTTVRMGYHDTYAVTAPVDGVYLQIVGTTLTGVAMSNSSETDTLDTVTLTQGAWYRAKLILNADATLATFTLFTCADGNAVAWVRNTVASNIPTGAGRYCFPDIVATNLNGDVTAKAIFSLDWFQFACSRTLVR